MSDPEYMKKRDDVTQVDTLDGIINVRKFYAESEVPLTLFFMYPSWRQEQGAGNSGVPELLLTIESFARLASLSPETAKKVREEIAAQVKPVEK